MTPTLNIIDFTLTHTPPLVNAPDPVDKYPGLNRGIYMLVWQMSGESGRERNTLLLEIL